MFDVFYWGEKPNLFSFEQPADNLDHAASLCKTGFYWYIYGGNDYQGFDFSWRPVPWEANHIHVFPSQWQRDGGVYLAHCDSVAQRTWHWRDEQSVRRRADTTKWQIPSYIDVASFDFSWHPDVHEPEYTYFFGTQWQSTGGPVWPGTQGIKLVDIQRARSVAEMSKWTIPDTLDTNGVDFSWHPPGDEQPYVYHFSSEWQQSSGLIYTVPGANDIKFIDELPGVSAAGKVVDIFFVDKGNLSADERFSKLQLSHPGIQRVRYANSMMDTISRCVNRTKTSKFWVITSENVYDTFDFTWHPASWQSYMTHVFPTQWSSWGDTFFINKWEFAKHAGWAQDIEDFPNLNFVTDQYVRTANDNWDMYYVEHGNTRHGFDSLKSRYPKIKIVRYVDNYLDTFKRIVNTTTSEYIWITSSLCDYRNFDFTWTPSPWQAEMIHVFGSESLLRGDTFYVHVPTFRAQMLDFEVLDFFNLVNYCRDQLVYRFYPEQVYYETDDLAQAIMQHEFDGPYAAFVSDVNSSVADEPSLWTSQDKVITSFNKKNSICVVPREAKNYIKTQVYDYPYIRKVDGYWRSSDRMDVVFISNGEPDERKYYDHTRYHAGRGVKWVRGVNGRMAAYKQAAKESSTPWFFAVFAKLEVDKDFDWFWQPDYFQEPKHYIFNAQNPLNGLEYGHQGMIAYNKRLVLETNVSGLDFTLSKPHDSVPILSGVAHFNQNPKMTWRTAFREVIKLKYFMDTAPTLETQHRLKIWLSTAVGDYAEWCLAGAADAVEYYESVNGDYDKLMLSYDWYWLDQYLKKKRNV